jgi:large subunit ribosomal protein L4
MASATAFSATGDKSGTVELPEGLFGVEPNPHVMWEAVVNFQANQRLGTVKVKTRAEVNRSNAKPWKQQGTGRARAGTFRSPLWVGGGRIHGPMPRDHSYKLPRKVRRLALKSALSDRAAHDRVVVIEALEMTEPKTRTVWNLLTKMDLWDQKVLVLTNELTDNLELSVRNLPNVVALEAREANTYTVLAADWVLVTRKGLEQLEEVFA